MACFSFCFRIAFAENRRSTFRRDASGSALDAPRRSSDMDTVSFLLAHLSDPHIGPLPAPHPRDLIGKRLTGYINWRRRDRIHDMDVLARLVADMHAQRPDHIMMTGDILNIALPAEFPLAASWLETLGDPCDVSFVPGNHDAYVRSAMPHLLRTFAPWTAGEGGRGLHYPYLRVRGEVALIGLSSGIPTAPFLASGALGRAQREAFADILRETQARGLMRVVMIHHPPWRGGATPGRGLGDARAFERILARYGAALVVHGHNHRTSVTHLKVPGGTVPVVGVASASAVPGSPRHRAAYHLYRISRGPQGWRIAGHARGLLPGTREIGDLGELTLAAPRDL
jgi:3',5'-cyclic AMP phosphodiesterase CpdA